MAQIQIKISKPVRKVKIIRSQELIDAEEEKQRLAHEQMLENELRSRIEIEEQQRLIKEQLEAQQRELALQKFTRPIFTEEFTISNLDKPLEISLSKIPEEAMPIEEVKNQVQEAYNMGFKDGQDATQATYLQEIEKMQGWVRNFDKINQDLTVQFSKHLHNFEESIASLSVFIAEHIIKYELSEKSELIINLAKQAIHSAENDEIFRIKVSPTNVKVLEQSKSELIHDLQKAEKINIAADNSLSDTDIILETSTGLVDGRLKVQMEKIRTAIEDLMKQPSVQEEIIMANR